MNVLELFSGTESVSRQFRMGGHITTTLDFIQSFHPDICTDILTWDYSQIQHPDVIWASPPCQTFSVASIGRHWSKVGSQFIPKSDNAVIGLKILDKTVEIISQLKPTYYYIENPRGMMRKVIEPILKKYGLTPVRHTVTYCQYGDIRQKPTDIWTNNPYWNPKPVCKPGSSCHVAAPRGSKTGTQGLKGSVDRSIIPEQLCQEIVLVSEPQKSTKKPEIQSKLWQNR